MIRIIWPEKRFVSDDTIAEWFADRVADNEIAPQYLGAKDTETMARALEDAGIITRGKDSD